MPRNKDLKRLVRIRMRKTGEAYTAARAQILAKSRRSAPHTDAPPAGSVNRRDLAAIAGMRDAALKAKTGCTWERWVQALDRLGAERMSHRDIAALVSTKYHVGDWWSQTVTVGYERIKGLRARGQRRDGSYEATKSKTFNVPVAALFAAWADANVRQRWLDGGVGKVRTMIEPKSMRLDGKDRSLIAVGFVAKGPSKSVVAVQHTKLRDREAANEAKQYWTRRLEALGAVLSTPS